MRRDRFTLQEGFHYDVDNRTGTIFNLSDKYSVGSLSVMAVGVVPHEVYGVMNKVRDRSVRVMVVMRVKFVWQAN